MGQKKILKPGMMTSGYKFVTICANGEHRMSGVHQLVAQAFLGAGHGKEVNHKNGIKTDNRLENLEWVTRSENIKHSHDIGLKKSGVESHLWKKLLPCQVQEIRQLGGKISQAKIGAMFNISQTYVGKIIHRTKWRQLA